MYQRITLRKPAQIDPVRLTLRNDEIAHLEIAPQALIDFVGAKIYPL